MIIILFQTPLSWNNFFGGMGGGTDSSSWVLGDNFGGESPLAWKIYIFNYFKITLINLFQFHEIFEKLMMKIKI